MKLKQLFLIFALLLLTTSFVIFISLFILNKLLVHYESPELQESTINHDEPFSLYDVIGPQQQQFINTGNIEFTKTIIKIHNCIHRMPEVITLSRTWTKMAGIDVYSAYYDNRRNTLFPNNPAIQLIAYSVHPIQDIQYGSVRNAFYCNAFGKNGKSSTTKGFVRKGPSHTNYGEVLLITCPLDKSWNTFDGEISVSLTRKSCQRSKIAMQVIRPVVYPDSKKKIAVCVKQYEYDTDVSRKVIEWIELQLSIGVTQIYVYSYKVHPNVINVFKYYSNSYPDANFTWTPIKYAQDESDTSIEDGKVNDWTKQRKSYQHLVPLNDCYYRSLNKHNYVINIDMEQMVLPRIMSKLDYLAEEYSQFDTIAIYRLISISESASYANLKAQRSFISTNSAALISSERDIHQLYGSLEKYVSAGFVIDFGDLCEPMVQGRCSNYSFIDDPAMMVTDDVRVRVARAKQFIN